jgi:hypothetical protein
MPSLDLAEAPRTRAAQAIKLKDFGRFFEALKPGAARGQLTSA